MRHPFRQKIAIRSGNKRRGDGGCDQRPPLDLDLIVGAILISRVVHIYGMYEHHGNGSVRFRQARVMGTTIAIVAMALWVIYLFVMVNL